MLSQGFCLMLLSSVCLFLLDVDGLMLSIAATAAV